MKGRSVTIGDCTLHRGDCLDVLRTLADGSADALIRGGVDILMVSVLERHDERCCRDRPSDEVDAKPEGAHGLIRLRAAYSPLERLQEQRKKDEQQTQDAERRTDLGQQHVAARHVSSLCLLPDGAFAP